MFDAFWAQNLDHNLIGPSGEIRANAIGFLSFVECIPIDWVANRPAPCGLETPVGARASKLLTFFIGESPQNALRGLRSLPTIYSHDWRG